MSTYPSNDSSYGGLNGCALYLGSHFWWKFRCSNPKYIGYNQLVQWLDLIGSRNWSVEKQNKILHTTEEFYLYQKFEPLKVLFTVIVLRTYWSSGRGSVDFCPKINSVSPSLNAFSDLDACLGSIGVSVPTLSLDGIPWGSPHRALT